MIKYIHLRFIYFFRPLRLVYFFFLYIHIWTVNFCRLYSQKPRIYQLTHRKKIFYIKITQYFCVSVTYCPPSRRDRDWPFTPRASRHVLRPLGLVVFCRSSKHHCVPSVRQNTCLIAIIRSNGCCTPVPEFYIIKTDMKLYITNKYAIIIVFVSIVFVWCYWDFAVTKFGSVFFFD